MARRDELTDEQWAILKSLIPEPERRADGKGRPLVEATLDEILTLGRP